MNRLIKIREYENDCYNFLKKKFIVVVWESLKKNNASFDFLCYDGVSWMTVDAKRIYNKKYIYITTNQKKCDLFIIKINKNNFVLDTKEKLIKKYNYKFEIVPKGVALNIDDQIIKKISRIVKKDRIEYPSIKNFIDKAIKEKLSKENNKK